MGPDNYWFGVGPQILPDRRGAGVNGCSLGCAMPSRATLIPILTVPGPGLTAIPSSRTSPGKSPNLAIQLPSNAVGTDFLAGSRVVALAPSGSGFQVLPYDLIGILFAAGEGLELNLLGLSLGVDPGQAGTVAAGPRQARDGGPINGSRRSL